MSFNPDVSTWRLVTPWGTPYRYLEGSTGEISLESASAQLSYIIRASDLMNFAAEAFPLVTTIGGGLVYPSRVRLPGAPALAAQRMTWKAHTPGRPIDPFGGDPLAPADTYEPFLEVTIQFATVPENDQEPDGGNPRTFLEVSSSTSAEFLTGNVRGTASEPAVWEDPMFPGSPGAVADFEVREIDVMERVTEVTTEWNVKWPQIPFDWFEDTLLPKLRAAAGKVNSTVMELFHDAPAETILYLGNSLDEEYTWRAGYAGRSPLSLTLRFLEKNFEAAEPGTLVMHQVTHNHEFRPGHGWRRLYLNVAGAPPVGNPIYASADLNDIFNLT